MPETSRVPIAPHRRYPLDAPKLPSALQPLFDDRAAAEYLATSLRHVRHLRETGRLGYVRVGRFPRYRQQDLDTYLARNAVEAVR